jgi:hypothetical protein
MSEVRISSQDMAAIVSRLSKERGRILDAVIYNDKMDNLIFVCEPFAIFIDHKNCPELSSVSNQQLKDIKLSAGGGSIIVENADVYIETVALIAAIINKFRISNSGGIVMDILMNKRMSAD